MRTPVVFYLLFCILMSVWGCSPVRHLDNLEAEAEKAYAAADHQGALDAYGRLIDGYRKADRPVDPDMYRRAGLIAFGLGKTSHTIEYLEQVHMHGEADEQTYRALAFSYREIDNLSREIRMLENYVDNYPGGDAIDQMKERLFITLVESLNFKQAYVLWDDIDKAAQENESLMTGYLTVLQALGHEEKATDLAAEILTVNRNNIEALDWLAMRHFRQAEELDRREREAYDKNRTHRQYARLLEALEIVNTDLRIALDYFERLYALKPKSEYASYLANIYERFQDEEKARYYRQRAQ